MSDVKIRRLQSNQTDFENQLAAVLTGEPARLADIEQSVAQILAKVRSEGDAAVLAYTRQFDGFVPGSMAELEIRADELQEALDRIAPEQARALHAAADRIRVYHERQMQHSWQYEEADGSVLGQKITPIDRVGIYVPGGRAAYPSSVLMNALPARVAGVAELIMVVPTPNGERNPLVCAAAAIAGVDRVFTIGGAQAVAALAWGTKTIPACDKIVGPGNAWVAAAKRQVFGRVGIDMIAGPSEICIVCDGDTDPDWIAMDLFSQAEHDVAAQSILICPDEDFIVRVEASIRRLLPEMERKSIIEQSLVQRGVLITVPDLNAACKVVNRIAPEHLELSVADPEHWLPHIRHAGAIFMGRNTSEALGDYSAGPNHVLPTSGTARFSSPLGVYDFQKRSSIIHFSEAGAAANARIASVLARGEGLTAHARSAEMRMAASGPASSVSVDPATETRCGAPPRP